MTREADRTIRAMAARCGMTAHTLRYYERIGLIQHVDRGPNGHRRYSDADEAWLKFLHWMRATHMPIREMLRYSALSDVGRATEQRQILEEHRAKLEAEIANLEKALSLLAYHVEHLRSIEDGQTVAAVAPHASWAA